MAIKAIFCPSCGGPAVDYLEPTEKEGIFHCKGCGNDVHITGDDAISHTRTDVKAKTEKTPTPPATQKITQPKTNKLGKILTIIFFVTPFILYLFNLPYRLPITFALNMVYLFIFPLIGQKFIQVQNYGEHSDISDLTNAIAVFYGIYLLIAIIWPLPFLWWIKIFGGFLIGGYFAMIFNESGKHLNHSYKNP